ncbi:hypothetical protein ELE36_02760 [Pseudolysobacter antarcticus]|uniref:DUF4492 domain-containing protein n=1 Tax=Pseudolysobacter antarcticus TaxID=2511995 RepID=A0A411HFZ3_9GAMM|nr:cytochrome oxidase putative small subunit CydP [Pseudolysobacter antarcticus]QBB69381.1 hypothetical protein ELE36_02760 [Pseudolysobacter antarcticus]
MNPSQTQSQLPHRLPDTPRSWFRSSAGRLYFSRLATIIVLKLVLLVGLYYAFLKPAVRPDASAAAIQHLLLDPAPPPTH